MMAKLRVPHSDILEDDDLVAWYQGRRFTGVAFEPTADGGVSEVEFRDGIQDGCASDFDQHGSLVAQTEYRSGSRHGREREWDADGSLVCETVWEYGVKVETRVWETDGERQIFRIGPDSTAYRLLEFMRASRGNGAKKSTNPQPDAPQAKPGGGEDE